MFHKSLRWRIQAWHGFLLVCAVGALLVAFYSYERAEKLRDIDTQLQATLTPLLPAIGGHPPGGGPGPDGPSFGRDPENPPDNRPGTPPRRNRRSEMDRLPEMVRNGKFYFVAWSPDGELINRSTNAPARESFPDAMDFQTRKPIRTVGGYREAAHYGPDGGMTVVGTSLAPMQADLQKLAWLLLISGSIIIAAGLAVGWWTAGQALLPLKEISATADTIAKGDLSKRIDISETDSELGKLAAILNGTFDKIERMMEEQMRFTADASHELRTPIAVLLTQIQLALSRPRTPEEYQQTLETCERAAERLRLLVNQLIELARIDAGDASLVWEKCDLARVARDAIEFIAPLAEKKQVKLEQEIESVRVKADVMKLGQVFINLLNNAIHHNKDGIEVRLSLKRNGDKAVIRISDNGVGIPKDALPHLFDRFYRVDKARARGKGNSGLGLAICKSIVEGHGGTIRAVSEPGEGSEFIIELPARAA